MPGYPSEIYPVSFRPTQRLWDECLGGLKKRARAAYVRTAVEAYIAVNPVIRAIPLDEPPDEPMSPHVVNFSGSAEVYTWLRQIPTLFRSYICRVAVNWYRRQYPPGGAVMQPTLLDDIDSATGS